MASLLAIEKAIEAYNERRGLRQAIIAAIDAAARVDGAHVDAGKASSAVDGDAQLSRYSDDEIAAEYARRAQAKLGDQRIGVGAKTRLK